MCGENTDTPKDQEDQLNLTTSESGKVDALLLEYEQTRIEIRRYIAQQGRIITAGIAALGAISGYAVMSSENGYLSSPLLVIVPFVVGLLMILSMEAENNATLLRKHNTEVQNEINDIIDSDNFGYQSQDYPTEDMLDIGIDVDAVNWYNVPFMFVWILTFLYLLTHALIVSGPDILKLSYFIIILFIFISAYAHWKVRQFEIEK